MSYMLVGGTALHDAEDVEDSKGGGEAEMVRHIPSSGGWGRCSGDAEGDDRANVLPWVKGEDCFRDAKDEEEEEEDVGGVDEHSIGFSIVG
ncbi:hypothetical protein DFQ27_000178 [Actinomortierella ambigua]|uniref:Uncharacterized protein n=1 Tax=Actinomortierella ambigua TaxID=1343610 RepID=A0A9P6PPA5_9FUNG|nr:hypothetical protein DFQ27_000178 [Actinomortierella ambigua]